MKQKIRHVLYFLRLFLNINKKFKKHNYLKPSVATSMETIKKMQLGFSIARFGDGEFEAIIGKDIKFQKADKLLSKRLREVLGSKDENILIGIPKIYTLSSYKNLTLESTDFWMNYLYREDLFLTIKNNKKYYDASVTRFYIRYRNKRISKKIVNGFKKIWGNKKIVIIEGEFSRLGFGNDLFDGAESIRRILCPSENAFERYDDILKEACKLEKDCLILISLGPTATVLAYDLAKSGYWAIDLGHIDMEYEWYLKGVSERTKVDNKYGNEVEDGNSNLKQIEDNEYLEQIIAKIL